MFFGFVHVTISYSLDKYLIIGTCKGNCFFETISEFVLTAKGSKDTHDIYIRLCTKDKLEVALSKTNFNLQNLNYWYQYHQMDVSKVPIFLSKQCVDKPTKNVLFQIIANNIEKKEIPFSFEDKVYFRDFNVTRIERDSVELSVGQFIQFLEKNPNSYGTILGKYNYSPSLKLKRNFQKAKLLLGKKKVSSARYFMQIIPSGLKTYPPDPEPSYLLFYVVELHRDKNSSN
jgi:hypothetical protein